jgi:hypothetical protein
MAATQQSVAEELAIEQGSICDMCWLVANANDAAQRPALIMLIVAGPGGRGRSHEIVALQLDTDGFPVQRARSPTAAVGKVLNRPVVAVTNYKTMLKVKAPSLQGRVFSREGWVRLKLWFECMYPRTSSSRQPAAVQHVAPDSLSSSRSRRRRRRSRAAAFNSTPAGNRQATAAIPLMYDGAAATGDSGSNSSSNRSSDADMRQLLVWETELVQMFRWSAADEPSQSKEQLLLRLHAAMQQLKRVPAGSIARTQFDANWAYAQAWRGLEDKQQTLHFLSKLIDDALDSTAD